MGLEPHTLAAAQVLVHVVSALFDINPSMSTHMPVHLWKKCVAVLLELLDLLKEHPNVILDEAYEVCAPQEFRESV